jgi:TPP-dependent 2-oxoacid decarboxylase
MRTFEALFSSPSQVSSPYCAEIVESADVYLFAGPIFNDYSSVGYSLLIKGEKSVRVEAERVRFIYLLLPCLKHVCQFLA